MKTVFSTLLIALALAGLSPSAFADTCTFEAGIDNNYWDNADNWDCEVVPSSNDTVILDDSDDDCLIRAAGVDQACISFSLVPGARLTIGAVRTLTISASSVVDGTLDMQGSLSLSSSLTISGDGLIILQQDTGVFTGQITGAGTLTLSDDGGGDTLRVIGTGEIDNDVDNNALVQAGTSGGGSFDGDLELRGDVSGSGTFEADDGMQLVLLGGATGSATWHTISSSSANQITLTVAACVSGPVNIERGRFQLEADFCTTGDLDLGDSGSANAGEVAVIAGATAQFGVSACSTCP